MLKTNAIRILENSGLQFKTLEYEVNENELDAVSVARKINFPVEQVFKTLITKADDKEYLVFIIPGNFELNLKKGAVVSGKKNIELVPVKEIENLTGYIRGGCSPIGMKKQFRTFIDETAQLFENISISAGKRGIQVIIDPVKLNELIKSSFVDIL